MYMDAYNIFSDKDGYLNCYYTFWLKLNKRFINNKGAAVTLLKRVRIRDWKAAGSILDFQGRSAVY